jgi:hypothetical protein
MTDDRFGILMAALVSVILGLRYPEGLLTGASGICRKREKNRGQITIE